MSDTIIEVVDLAKIFKDFISHTSVKYAAPHLMDDILRTNDDDFLKVRRKIGSATTILAVDKIDDAFVNRAILGD